MLLAPRSIPVQSAAFFKKSRIHKLLICIYMDFSWCNPYTEINKLWKAEHFPPQCHKKKRRLHK